MKKLITYTIVLVVFLGFNTIAAQEVATTTSKKATINSSDKDINIVVHNDITYYIIDGIWHTKMKKRYVLRSAPKGAKIDFRPADGEYVTMYGKKYYKCKGVFYKELKDSIYEVVL
tara:strand:- start:35462 stop:35809 length:348 start_codon:yes stop_codon:yes gene_type:complete